MKIKSWVYNNIFQPELGLVLLALLLFEIYNKSFASLQDQGIWALSLSPLIAVAFCLLAPGPRATDVIMPIRIVAIVLAICSASTRQWLLSHFPLTFPR